MTSLWHGLSIGVGLFIVALIIVFITVVINWWRGRVIPPAAPAAGAAAPAVVVAGIYDTYLAWAFTKKTLWVLLALVVIVALMWGLAVHNWNPRALAEDEWRGVPYWVLAIAAAAVAVAIRFGDRKRLLSLLGTAALVVLIIVVYRSYHDSNGPNTEHVVAPAPQPAQVGVTLVATLTSNPIQLKPPHKNIWWREFNPSECLKVYAAEDNRYLGDDCGGKRLDLKNTAGLKFASASGQQMIIQYGLVEP